MKETVANHIKVLASELSIGDALNKDDIKALKFKAPLLLFKVKEIMKSSKKGSLKDLSPEDMVILISYIICIRQNMATTEGDKPNLEDTARILHGEIYDTKDKKDLDNLEKELKRQLSKIGIVLK